MKYILSIDQGTTGSRAVIYDKKGAIKASSHQEFPQYFPKSGWVEHDPEEIWDSVNTSIQKVLKKIPAKNIAAIGITNQRETTVVWDKMTGKAISKAIVWQCRRTADRCNRLKKKKGMEAIIREKTGLPIDAYFSATKLECILENIKNKNNKNLLFGTTDSWVLWKLTGGKTHATDYTNASRTMLFNIEKLKWDKKLLKEFSVPKSILPEVKPSSGFFGKTAKIGKLDAGIPISGVAGDQQAALFGQTCFSPGSMKNTYGTGAFMLMNTGKKRVKSKFGLITTLACDAKGKPAYALEGAIFIAGAAIQWLRDGLGLLKKASESEKMALSVEGDNDVYFVPALVGLGAPYWNSEARGIITGITRGTKKEHIVRAALESMCYQTKDVLEAMQKDSGFTVKNLRVDGGATANNFMCQFQADVLGIDVIRPKVIEGTSLGAAYLAGLAVGYWKNSDEIKKCWGKDRVFKPKIGKKDSALLYKGWEQAVKLVLN